MEVLGKKQEKLYIHIHFVGSGIGGRRQPILASGRRAKGEGDRVFLAV